MGIKRYRLEDGYKEIPRSGDAGKLTNGTRPFINMIFDWDRPILLACRFEYGQLKLKAKVKNKIR